MVAINYHLDTLYSVRKQTKNGAEQSFSNAIAREIREQAELDNLRNKKTMLKKEAQDRVDSLKDHLATGKISAATACQHYVHISSLNLREVDISREMVSQKEKLYDAIVSTECAKEKMVDATSDYKALQKHKAKWSANVKNTLLKKEEDEYDDISQARFRKIQP